MKSKIEYNAYMKKYMLERYRQRRNQALEYLGNKCVQCNSIEKLELDHIDPKTKRFHIGKFPSIKEDLFWEEIKKCQILCKPCHTLKTMQDLGQQNARLTHGTESSYRYCKCDICRLAHNKYAREYKTKKRKELKALTNRRLSITLYMPDGESNHH